MTGKDKLEKAKALALQANAALAEGTPDAIQRGEGLFKEAQDLKAQAAREIEIMQFAESISGEVAALEQKSAPRQPQAEPERKTKFDGMEEWMGSVTDFLTKGKTDPRLKIWSELGDNALPLVNEQKQMVENVGASGGFLVPTEVSTDIMAQASEQSIVRSRATIIRMNRRQYDKIVLDQTGTTAGQSHWHGGMVAYWGEEAAEKTITNAKWRTVSLVAKKLYAYARASDELVDDAVISLNDYLQSDLGMAGLIAWNEDLAFIQGNGGAQPLGVINAGATITVNRNSVANIVDYEDLTHMLEHHMQSPSSVWVASISLKNVLMNMTYPSGNPALVWQPSARDSMPDRILGIPVLWTEKCPLAGSAGDLILADWKHYLVGDRRAMTFASTNAEYFKYDQTSWRMVHRVDGRPWMSAPITLQDSTSTISPFVILGAKST